MWSRWKLRALAYCGIRWSRHEILHARPHPQHTDGVSEGLCRVSAMHITAAIIVNDDEIGHSRH